MKNIDFTEATASDLANLLDLYNFYLRNTTATFDYDEIDMDEFRSRISFQHGSCKTYLIKTQGELAGFCFLTQFKNKPALDRPDTGDRFLRKHQLLLGGPTQIFVESGIFCWEQHYGR
ncbi:MAG: hypothetical protein P8107_09060 [Spirochaetia bacterium]